MVAFGVLGDQTRAELDAAEAVAVVHTDYVAQVSILTIVANLMRAQGSGQIVVFSSIAGVRVRRANYVYGSAKAGLDGFACGLADALHGSGVHLLLVRSGFVIGRMTEGMTPVPLLSSTPEQVAAAVVDGLRPERAVWVPRRLGPAAAVMRLVPQGIWRRMPRWHDRREATCADDSGDRHRPEESGVAVGEDTSVPTERAGTPAPAGEPAMANTGAARSRAPAEPSKGASPKAKTPPS